MRRVAAFAAAAVVVAGCGSVGPTATTLALDVESYEELEPLLLDDERVAAVLAGSTPGPEYSSEPPTSGARAAVPPRCGIHRVAIPEVYQVAALAQGSILVQYRASFTADARHAVEQAVRPLGSGVIVAPNPTLAAPVVLTAWGKLMTLPFADPVRIAAFVEQFGGSGPSPQDCPFVVDDA